MYVARCDKCSKEIITSKDRIKSIFGDDCSFHHFMLEPHQQTVIYELAAKGKKFQYCSAQCLLEVAQELVHLTKPPQEAE